MASEGITVYFVWVELVLLLRFIAQTAKRCRFRPWGVSGKFDGGRNAAAACGFAFVL